jgi:hypothetical protein
MEEPSKELVDRLKAKLPDRQLHLVTIKNEGDDEEYHFIMTGANSDEYKLFIDQTFEAREKAKTTVERNEKLEEVALKAIQRQTVWPERDDLKALLFKMPGFVGKLADKITDHAGSSAEVRSKKL